MDNATQLVLFHLFEHGLKAHALLPYYIDSIDLFNPLTDLVTDLGHEVRVEAQLSSITDRGTKANIDLVDSNDQLLARFKSIMSRRIVLDEKWSSVVNDPLTTQLGSRCPQLLKGLPDQESWACVEMSDEALPSDDVALSWCLDYVLSKNEQDYYQRNLHHPRRKRDWILGRIALKQAVRVLLKQKGISACPADIEITRNDNGPPSIGGRCAEKLGFTPFVSISHKDGYAIALASSSEHIQAIAIDVENVVDREDGFEQLAFTAEELLQLHDVPVKYKNLAMTQLWCAKEALGKALNGIFLANPKKIKVLFEGFDPEFRVGYGTIDETDMESSHLVLCHLYKERAVAVCAVAKRRNAVSILPTV